MQARTRHCLLAAAAVLATLPVAAAERSDEPPCALPAAEGHVMADRAGTLQRYERLPRSCLQEIFTACTLASRRTLLDPGSAAVCSFGYEALLSQGFNGSFPALLAWWRSQQGQAQP